MKRLFYSVFVTLLFSLSALAQNEGINFQGVARNTAGEVLVSQKINLRLSILLGSETGTVAYVETRQVTTNPQGVFAVVVGDDKALTKSTNFFDIFSNSMFSFFGFQFLGMTPFVFSSKLIVFSDFVLCFSNFFFGISNTIPIIKK